MANLVVFLSVIFAGYAVASPVPNQSDAPDGLIFMGATENKELFITYPNITGDFTQSLVVGCPLRFNMELVAVESLEEVAIIDNYFEETQGNSSDHAWTSAVSRIGLIPSHWASTGLQITEFPAEVKGPWPSGAGSSPTYANYNCVTIQRACVRPPGTPIPGCFPAQTQFMYSVCNTNHRYICQKRIA